MNLIFLKRNRHIIFENKYCIPREIGPQKLVARQKNRGGPLF